MSVRPSLGWTSVHQSHDCLLESYLCTSLMLTKNKLHVLGFVQNCWILLKYTTATSCHFSILSVTQFWEITPFNNKQTCLNKTRVLLLGIQLSTGSTSG